MDSKVVAYIHETAVVSPRAHVAKGVEIGPYAVIEENVTLAENVKVGAHAVIGANVSIGEGTRIEPHAVINSWTSIGKDSHIFQFASVGAEPQDLKFKGEKSYTIIGDRTTIREY